jgi:type I site-specific restriction-modification system R (restriction) subunit/very-short-patch-repair endonuclease
MTEDQIEQLASERLQALGYAYAYGPAIAHDGERPERSSHEQVLLLERLREAVRRINPRIPAAAQEEAVKQVARIASPELLVNNEVFHRMLTEGVKVDYQQDGNTRGDLVWLVDFANPANNDLLVVNQFTVVENGKNKRPDVLLFVNGLPLVLMELKNAADENASLKSAWKQIETYKETIPGLFTYNAVVVISDGLEAKAGTVSSGFSRYMSWKTSDGKVEASPLIGQLETLITGMLDPKTLLDLVRHFIVFERSKKQDPVTGINTITTVKKVAAYHQYYAVNRAVASTLRAAGFNSPPGEGWPKAGVVQYASAVPPLRLAAEGGENLPALTGTSPGEGNLPPRLSGTPPGEVIYPKVPRNSKKFFDLPFNPALKERAKELRKARNLAEVVFWQQVHKRKFKGYDFDRQKIVGNYIVDFYCANVGVVIEIDGKSHDHKQEYDARRDEYLRSLGLTIIRIPATGVLKHLVQTMAWLENHPALAGTPPEEGNSPPRPSGTPPEEGNLIAESPESYGVPGVSKQAVGDRKGGVVWHTQGSGKSLSMVFYTGKVVLAMDNPTVVVITDRNDLDDQLFDTFAASVQLLRQEPVQAESRGHLKELLKVASGGVVFTTIQKFQPDEGNVFDRLSDRENIVVIADEAHRTQYGFKARTVDDRDAAGNVVGQRVVYGFAKYLRDALPNATYLGFTGTPIESTDVNTPAVFGHYVDVYDIAQAVEDGATVRIYYESRLAKVNLSEEGRRMIQELDKELDEADLSDTQRAKAKWTQLEALIGSEDRIRNVARDIVAHFEQRQEVFAGKGMIVAMSRRIAVELYDAIIALRPEWHDDDLKQGRIKVVMTAASSDGPAMARHHSTKEQRRMLAERMKDPKDPLQLVIVRDMWLTGFDAPSLHTIYIDKPMKGHNLMQAIARVNRVYGDKPGGLVVDYLGIAADLKKALSFYSDAGGKGDPTTAQEQAVALMLEKLEVVSAMYHGFAYEEYFAADTARKLSIILAAEEHILGLENGKKRYIDAVTALSKAFAIAVPHDQAMDVKDEVGFFQAVKARLVKFDATGNGRTDQELETTIRQVIDRALVSEQVIDIYDAAGIKKPDISVLSEEFLEELKGMPHKNLAIEVLKKLLADEIKARARTNLVQGRSLMEMLEDSIRRYHNKILTAAEVIEELIQVGREIANSDKEASELGMSDYEYAFYTAVANNASARELMQQDQLRELAVVLTERVRQNASIDWTIKESVRAKLKVIVKRTLRQYGYPPDMQKLATDLVLRQAEVLANELSH